MNEPVKRATRRASSARQAQQALQSECSEASVAFIAKPSAVERVGPLKMQLSRAETDPLTRHGCGGKDNGTEISISPFHCGPTLLSTSEGTSMPKMEKQKTPNLIFELYD